MIGITGMGSRPSFHNRPDSLPGAVESRFADELFDDFLFHGPAESA